MNCLLILIALAATTLAACPMGKNGLECGGCPRGVCRNVSLDETGDDIIEECICSPSYAGDACDHRRKQRIGAFLLQFFLGTFGAGYFYLGHIGLGVGILMLSLFGCCLGCIVGGIGKATDSTFLTGLGSIFGCLSGLAVFGWWLASSIIMGMNNMNDSHGYKPESW